MTGQGVLIFTYGIMASLDSLNTPKYNVVFDFIAPKQLIKIIILVPLHDFVFISNWLISNSTEIFPKIKQLKIAQY